MDHRGGSAYSGSRKAAGCLPIGKSTESLVSPVGHLEVSISASIQLEALLCSPEGLVGQSLEPPTLTLSLLFY